MSHSSAYSDWVYFQTISQVRVISCPLQRAQIVIHFFILWIVPNIQNKIQGLLARTQLYHSLQQFFLKFVTSSHLPSSVALGSLVVLVCLGSLPSAVGGRRVRSNWSAP